MELSVEATSLYLLMVPLSDAGTPLERKTMLRFWNSGEDELDRALVELLGRGVISGGGHDTWRLEPIAAWKRRQV